MKKMKSMHETASLAILGFIKRVVNLLIDELRERNWRKFIALVWTDMHVIKLNMFEVLCKLIKCYSHANHDIYCPVEFRCIVFILLFK